MRLKLRFGIMALVAVAALGLASCDWRAQVNPPPGGGEVATETFALGPFNLGPGHGNVNLNWPHCARLFWPHL